MFGFNLQHCSAVQAGEQLGIVIAELSADHLGPNVELLIETGAFVALLLLTGANQAGRPFIAMKAQLVLIGDDGSSALSDDFPSHVCIKNKNVAHTGNGSSCEAGSAGLTAGGPRTSEIAGRNNVRRPVWLLKTGTRRSSGSETRIEPRFSEPVVHWGKPGATTCQAPALPPVGQFSRFTGELITVLSLFTVYVTSWFARANSCPSLLLPFYCREQQAVVVHAL